MKTDDLILLLKIAIDCLEDPRRIELMKDFTDNYWWKYPEEES